MEPAENSFNPFIDDVDAVEDSVVSELDNFPPREKNEFYEPAPPHKLTEDDYKDEMPPETALDFDQEIEEIIAEREQFANIKLPTPEKESSATPSDSPDYMAEADDLLAAFEQDLEPLPNKTNLEEPVSLEDLDDLDLDSVLAELEATLDNDRPAENNTTTSEDLVIDDDDWGFLTEEDSEPSLPQASSLPSEEINLADDDWGFISDENDESSLPENPNETLEDISLEDINLDDWDFEIPEDLPSGSNLPDVEEESLDLADLDLDEDFIPPANPFEIPEEFQDDQADSNAPDSIVGDQDEDSSSAPTGGIKAKLSGLLAQIKAELKGDDAPENSDSSDLENNPAPTLTNDDSQPRASNGIMKKLLFPITFVMTFFGGLLGKLFDILGSIPAIGKIFKKIGSSQKLMNALGLIVPLALIIGVLYWHGNGKFAVTDDSVSFPDGGKASIQINEVKGNKVSFTIKNEGDVIAEVTPTVIVYGTKLSANPLSLFYPAELKTCKGKVTTVAIDKTKELEIDCAISGYRKQASGRIEW